MSQEAELQKVKDLLDMGFIHDEEYERRIKEICGNGPIPPAFRIGGSASTADPFEEERRRQEEEELVRREMEEERRRMEEEAEFRRLEEQERKLVEAEEYEMRRRVEEQERMIREVEEMRRREEEAMRLGSEEVMRKREEEERLRRTLEEKKRMLEEKRRMLEQEAMAAKRMAEEMAKREAEEMAMREAEERRRRELEEMHARGNQTTTSTPPAPTNTNAKMTDEERRKAIEERQARDKKRWAEEVAEEQKRQSESLRNNQNYGYYNSTIGYEPQDTPAFDPNATYSTPEYYAPTGIKLYPIYPPNYFSTVHPFSFIAANKNDPQDQSAINAKIEELKRIIGDKQGNPSRDWEEKRREQEYAFQERTRQETMEALKKKIAETPKQPFPTKVDDGIDPNTLPKPTVHMIPPRKWDDSSEPYEAPKYILPTNPNGVIVIHRSQGSVCQTKELDSPTLESILKIFEMTDGKLTNIETGEEFKSQGPVPRGCYRLQSIIDTHFYRSMGTMPLLSSTYTHYNSGGRNSFNLQYANVPSAITHKNNTYYADNVVFSYGNVRTTSNVHNHSYNESTRPRGVPGSSYGNYSSGGSAPVDPNWFKKYREENIKLDYVVCIRNVYRKFGKIPPLRLHRALKDSLDNNKCVVCKQFAQEMLCETHKDERFTELMRSVGGNFGEIFGVSTEPTPMEEEVETPIYYKNYGEVVEHGNDNFKAQFIDFSDPNLQPKWALNGILAERFNRIKENARMTYDMMMNDDFLVHKPGSEQMHLHD